MDIASLVGIISGVVMILSAILIGGGAGIFINVPGLMIVIGGTTAAALLTFPLHDVVSAFRAAYHVFRETET
jgi:chemotaxis protein MotA